jgi:hypothetical protein
MSTQPETELERLRDRHARIAALQAEETNLANAELLDILQRDYADRIWALTPHTSEDEAARERIIAKYGDRMSPEHPDGIARIYGQRLDPDTGKPLPGTTYPVAEWQRQNALGSWREQWETSD